MYSFVIPLFNEEESIGELYREILENVSDYELIFVDDGSTDGSYQILKEIAAADRQVKIIKFRKNFGKAAALQAGFDIVKGEIIFTLDADLQDDPGEIKRFVEKINAGYDLVSGWKEVRRDPLSKRLPSKLYNFVNRKIFHLSLHDQNCGFKAYRRECLKELDIYGEMHRYIPALAQAKGFRIAEISVNHRQRVYGKSKYGLERYLRGFWDLLTVKLVTSFNRTPLYMFGGIGTFLVVLGFLIDLYLTVAKLFCGTSLSNRPLLFLGVLLILMGMQFISTGLIAELLVNQTRKLTANKSISIELTHNIGADDKSA